MNLPTEEQIKRGNQVAAEMIDATVAQAFEGSIDHLELEFPEIIALYIADKIDSVTGIYLAMQGE